MEQRDTQHTLYAEHNDDAQPTVNLLLGCREVDHFLLAHGFESITLVP